MLYLYTVIEAIVAVAAGIFMALRTKKAEHITYGKLDRIGQITNIMLLLVYICFAPLYLFLGMISNPALIGSFYPGLDAVELSQQAYYMPPIATHPCEIVLVEVKNEADAQKVADIFQARIDMGADNTSYPESAAGWALYAQVHKSGNFVCMIVLPEGYVIPENVFEIQ